MTLAGRPDEYAEFAGHGQLAEMRLKGSVDLDFVSSRGIEHSTQYELV